MEIKDLLKSRRLEKGLTMKEVADAVGVNEGTISRYESGDIANMKRSSIVALSKVLDIPPIRFITLDPIEEKVPNRQTQRIPFSPLNIWVKPEKAWLSGFEDLKIV